MLDFLKQEGIDPYIVEEIERFRTEHPASPEAAERIPTPRYSYYGREIWEAAATALLCGEHLLLVGPKATGKNVLAENLAAAFGRPSWDISLYVNTDASSLIGTDTFDQGRVSLRPGPVYQCARLGGFGVLDEINMAKNEALAVLHATLDFRRVIDVPGYDRIPLHDAARFIATMNYGYAGTRELNEALASRFVVINMPVITRDNLKKLLNGNFHACGRNGPSSLPSSSPICATKCDSSEISTKSLDMRGLLAAIRLTEKGLPPPGPWRWASSTRPLPTSSASRWPT